MHAQGQCRHGCAKNFSRQNHPTAARGRRAEKRCARRQPQAGASQRVRLTSTLTCAALPTSLSHPLWEALTARALYSVARTSFTTEISHRRHCRRIARRLRSAKRVTKGSSSASPTRVNLTTLVAATHKEATPQVRCRTVAARCYQRMLHPTCVGQALPCLAIKQASAPAVIP
jgi:hypothetical protein